MMRKVLSLTTPAVPCWVAAGNWHEVPEQLRDEVRQEHYRLLEIYQVIALAVVEYTSDGEPPFTCIEPVVADSLSTYEGEDSGLLYRDDSHDFSVSIDYDDLKRYVDKVNAKSKRIRQRVIEWYRENPQPQVAKD